jgi:hypothetical protein
LVGHFVVPFIILRRGTKEPDLRMVNDRMTDVLFSEQIRQRICGRRLADADGS